jgi:type II secretory pathway pseudopilin PulG
MTSTHDEPAADSGIGIVEIVIAMFLLALLATATLPLFVSTLKLANGNSTVTTGTQLVDEQLSQARSQTATCGALTAFAATAVANVTDGAGKSLATTRTVSCPASYPGTARFTATVRAGTTVVASATTLIYVSAA